MERNEQENAVLIHISTFICGMDLEIYPINILSTERNEKMAYEEAFAYLKSKGYGDRVQTFDVSSATVELAAVAVGTEPARIAKSLTFMVEDQPVMIIAAGDAKVNNSKYKGVFHKKAKMLTAEEVHSLIGHDVGGVCPFGIKDGVDVYLDESLKRFEKVYPACGSANSAVELTPEELEQLAGSKAWIDVCKIPEEMV